MTALKATLPRLLRVWWALAWRTLIVMLVSAIALGFVGFVVGYFLGSIGVPMVVIEIVWAFLGVLGLAVSLVPLWLVLGKDFGEFKLVLVARDGEAPLAPSAHEA